MRCITLSLSLIIFAGCPTASIEPSTPKTVSQGNLPSTLASKQIQQAMSQLNPQIKECLSQNQTPGKVEMKLTLANNGHFRDINPIRLFKDSALGACIKEVLRDAVFPQFTGDEMIFIYPFILLPSDMSTSQFNSALNSLRNKAKQCGTASAENGEVNIQFLITSSGSTEIIKTTGSLLASPIASCVRQVISTTEFPSSSDEMKMNEQFIF